MNSEGIAATTALGVRLSPVKAYKVCTDDGKDLGTLFLSSVWNGMEELIDTEGNKLIVSVHEGPLERQISETSFAQIVDPKGSALHASVLLAAPRFLDALLPKKPEVAP